MSWTIREGGAADAEACHAVYLDAVRNGTSRHYTPEQALAWAPSEQVEDWLPPRLEAGTTWIAFSDRRAEGFLTVTGEGHLDFFFVRPDARASGLAATLYDRMLDLAEARGQARLTTFASHLARSFLERRGWQVIEGESALRNGVELKRWKMACDAPFSRSP